MIATFFHIFLWMTTNSATNKKILTKTQTQTHEMLSTPLPFPHPPPNYHFTHAKVLGQLSEERVQEVGQKRQGQEIC